MVFEGVPIEKTENLEVWIYEILDYAYKFCWKDSMKSNIHMYVVVSEWSFLGPEILQLKFINKSGYEYAFLCFYILRSTCLLKI
jgi:hypothetical protein